MKRKNSYDEPKLEIVLLEETVITASSWTENSGALGGEGTPTDSDEFENMFK